MSAQLGFDGIEPTVIESPAPHATERDVLNALRRRYTKAAGNGQRYVLAEHVRDRSAWASRTADLIVRDTWDSSGMALHGFEVKVSRSDWLTELRDPSKADRFRIHCDYWWLAVSDKTIVRDDLPEGWGLLVMAGTTLRAKTPATRIESVPMDAGMRTALDRAIAKTAKRHLILDIEAGQRQACERYVPGHSCFTAKVAPCWSCRAALLADSEANR